MDAAPAPWSDRGRRGEVMDNDFDVEGISVLPIQFLDRSFQGAELQPEKRLQLVVLADAATTYARSAVSTVDAERAALVELEEWFASETAAGPFSFVGICDSLGFDPAY